MTTLQDKLNSIDPNKYSLGFMELMQFTLPHEVVFQSGHDGDYDFVAVEHDPSDPGGTTKYGVDQSDNPHVNVETLTFEGALDVFFQTVWRPCRGDVFNNKISVALCDAGINVGIVRATKWMQEAAQVEDDGNIGPETINAVSAADPSQIMDDINSKRDVYYRTEVRQALRDKYLNGWENRLHDLEAFETSLPDPNSSDATAAA